jgi:hypothetical protein
VLRVAVAFELRAPRAAAHEKVIREVGDGAGYKDLEGEQAVPDKGGLVE